MSASLYTAMGKRIGIFIILTDVPVGVVSRALELLKEGTLTVLC
jgi:hypothetical protein